MDYRSQQQKHDHLHGVPETTFNPDFALYRIKPQIQTCVVDSSATYPSLHHSPNMNTIFSIYRDPSNKMKGIINIYNDQEPYDLKQEPIKINTRVFYSTGAIDRRSDKDQLNLKFAIFGVSDHNSINQLVKVAMDENSCFKHIVSDEKYKDKLLKCIIVSDDLVLTLRPFAAFIHDASTLKRKHEVKWNNSLPVEVRQLNNYGSTTSYSTTD